MISIVIPCRQIEAEGAYLTAASAFTQLEKLDQQFEIIFAVDLGAAQECKAAIGEFSNSSVLYVRKGSPQGTRDAGIRAARGTHVFCLDSHVICSVGFFEAALERASRGGAAMIFAPLCFRDRRSPAFGYSIGWETDFWNAGYHNNPHAKEPYRIAAAGHGAFYINRDIYVQTGGYTLEQKGWGGEETFLCLKLWMLGYDCWMLPDHYQWHWMAPGRNSGTTRTFQYAYNFCLAAYAIGGFEGGLSVFQRFCQTIPELKDKWHDIENAMKDERERIKRGPYSGSVKKLRAFFTEKGIPQ